MWPYWMLFALFAVGALSASYLPELAAGTNQQDRSQRAKVSSLLALCMVILALMIGLRFDVGGDWETYQSIFDWTAVGDVERALRRGDPAYQLLNWAVAEVGADIWLVNLVCASIFTLGLYRFATLQEDPWLAAVVAIPYLVVVIAMGYTRQAVAIGVIMAGLASLFRGGTLVKFIIYAAAAAMFHRTALIVVPLAMLRGRGNLAYNLLVGAAATFALYNVFLEDSMDQFVRGYIKAGYDSSGAAIRVGMSVIPAATFLFFAKKLEFGPDERAIWRNFSFAALAAAVALTVSPSTTAVDRIALYLLPLQLAVLPRLPRRVISLSGGRLMVITYAAAVLAVWLLFAQHSEYWLPYQFYPFAETGSHSS